VARSHLIVLTTSLFVGMTARASAQAGTIVVERRGPPVVIAQAGGHSTLVFRVTNRTSNARTVAGHLVLPKGWRLLVPEGTLSLPSRGSDLQLLQVALPLSVIAGRYPLRYAVAPTTAAPNDRAEMDSVVVDVPRHQRVTVTAENVPRFVVAGATYRTSFLVRNDGNVPANLRLRTTSGEKYPVRIDSDAAMLHLAPGAEQHVGVAVATNADLTHRLVHRVQLDVSASGEDSVHAAGVSTVEIIARKQESPSRFRSMPAQLAIRRDEQDGTVSMELLGSGLLTPGGATQVSFLARTPSSRTSLYGQQDEYWLQLATPQYGLRLGDQRYFSSRISDAGFPAVGASADVALGALRLGAYGQRDRRGYTYTQGQQYGGSLDLRLPSGDTVGIGYLMRQGQGSGNVLSGRGALKPVPNLLLTGEYGKGIGSVHGDAYVVSLGGRDEAYTYAIQRQAADTGFAGNWRGTSFTSAFTTLRPPGPIDLSGSYSDFSSEQILSNPFSVPARQQILDAGFNVSAAAFGAFYRYARQNSLALFSLADGKRHAQSIRVNVGLPFIRAFSLRAEMEHGYTIDDAAPTDRLPFRRWALRAGGSRFGQSLAVSVERLQGTPVYSSFPLDQISGTVSTQIQIAGATTLNLGWNGNKYRGIQSGSFSLFDIGFGRQFSAGQHIGYRSRSLATGNQIEPLYRQSVQQLEYVTPLGLPIGLSEDAGTVQVSLVDDQTGRPVSDVLLRLGDQARITDEYGRAEFIGLSAQTYYLEVDRSKIGRGRVITPVTPAPIILRSNETKQLDLHLIGSATVRGQVRALRAQPRRLGEPDSLVDAGPLAGVPIIVSSNADTLRTVSDVDGHFRMVDLHPGHWIVDASGCDLTTRNKLEQSRIELDLRPGDSREIEFRVAPVSPPVKIVAKADLSTHLEMPPGNVGAATPRRAKPAAPIRPPGWPVPDGRWRPPVTHHFTFSRRDGGLADIAHAMYDNAALWPKIWLANLDKVSDPDRVPSGIRLRVPDAAPLTSRELAAYNAYRVFHHRPVVDK
jgi:hypothetical protein